MIVMGHLPVIDRTRETVLKEGRSAPRFPDKLPP